MNFALEIVKRAECAPFMTADGSTIREFLNPRNSLLRDVSLAEATLAPGQATQRHFHPRADEIYYILQGQGEIEIAGRRASVGVGDAIAIPHTQAHQIRNTGAENLIFLCVCAPAYTHEDTVFAPI